MSFLHSTAMANVTKANNTVTLGLQIYKGGLKPGFRKDGTIIQGKHTLWADVKRGDNTRELTVLDGEKVWLESWDDSTTWKVQCDEPVANIAEAIDRKLYFAEAHLTVRFDQNGKAMYRNVPAKGDRPAMLCRIFRINTITLMAALPESLPEGIGEGGEGGRGHCCYLRGFEAGECCGGQAGGVRT